VIVDLYLLDGTAQSVSESQWNMSAEVKKEIALEIAHVLFIDIVGYSKLSINEQNAAVVHNETLSVVAMRVSGPGRSPVGIHA
jgi:hypothetical protein